MIGLAGLAGAQSLPERPLRIVVPYPAGGQSDYAARVVSFRLAEVLKRPVVVDNRPGANGMLGTGLVARSAPDGTTLVVGSTGTLGVLPHLQPQMPYDVLKDFTPIVNLIGGPSFLLIHPSLPAKNLRELIALAKRQPGALAYTSSGHGAISHINGELLKQLAGIDLLHVPYKSAMSQITELVGGMVSMSFSTSVDTLQFVKSGRVRLLAVTGKQRLQMIPDTPTMEEAGLPGFDSLNWNGIVGPANIPRDIVNLLNREMLQTINSPDVVAKIAALGNYVIGGTPEEFGAFIRAESDKWGRVVKLANIKIE
jgi:tripartite-type tricarboxylate transporter receptor subunit TctC